jgi:N-acetylmuramic acid 6-phosphate etherase
MERDESEDLPITEQENPRAVNLERLSSLEIVRLMNEEDACVAGAVEKALPQVAQVVGGIVERLKAGGRLFYLGTGTSGRLGVLDASECPPTFGVSAELVQGVMAGGYEALFRATEASEDDERAPVLDLEARGFEKRDALVGLTASGSTPYTVGAVRHARHLGAFTAAVTCVPDSAITREAEVSIVAVVGAEVLAGSTRLKAGTAQKMILNMISTATMVRLGYVAGNRMSNLQARNAKLRRRAVRILMGEAGLDESRAQSMLDAAEGSLPVALVMSKTDCSREEAVHALEASRGVTQRAVDALQSSIEGSQRGS